MVYLLVFILGAILGSIIMCIVVSYKVSSFQNKISGAIEYINKFKVTHNIDGDIAYLDEFHILASPKALLNILTGENNE